MGAASEEEADVCGGTGCLKNKPFGTHVDKPVVELQELKLSQQETLTESGTYEIENADGESEKRYRIPVSNAMNLIIAEEKSRSSAEEISEGSIATR